MPAGTDVMDNRTEVWMPLGLNPANRQNRGSHFLYLIGRLRDGVTPQAARTELDALIRNWGERTGAKNHVFAPLGKQSGHILQMKPMREEILGEASQAIWVLQVAVGFVLLIACANLANLLLARAEARHREFAVRTASGAGRGRLLRQFMTEGVILSLAGGALGLLLARLGVQALLRAYPDSLPRASEVAVDMRVLLFTFGVSMGTGVIFGLAPILHIRMKGLITALKEGGARGATRTARHHIRRGLVMAEVALAVMLVIGAGLLLRTVYNLTSVDAGFDRSRLVTFSMTLPIRNYPQPSARAQAYQRLIENLRAVPACRRRPRCPVCRQIGRSTRTTPTSTITRRPPKVLSRTSTTTSTSCPTTSRRWAFRSCRDAVFSGPTRLRPVWWRSSTKRSSTHSGKDATRLGCGCGRAAAMKCRGSPSSASQRT